MGTKTLRTAIVALSCGLAECAGDHSGVIGAVDAGPPASANVGAKALAELKPVDPSYTTADRPFMGTATFTATAVGVDAKISLAYCKAARNYTLVIYEGADCTDTALQGPAWDSERGQDIKPVACGGSSGWVYYSRASSAAKPWTIAGPTASNIVGHILVALDPDSMQPALCGKITADQTAPTTTASIDAGSAPLAQIRADIRAHLAGFCVAKMIARPPKPDCPNPEQYAECAGIHCELAACVQQCADYVTCLETASDLCSSMCPLNQECASCRSRVQQCTFGHCADMLECSAPTPGGPCSELEACCALQGNRAQPCLDAVRQVAKIAGDPTCVGLKYDGDFNTNLAYDPPCNFGPPPDAGTQP